MHVTARPRASRSFARVARAPDPGSPKKRTTEINVPKKADVTNLLTYLLTYFHSNLILLPLFRSSAREKKNFFEFN